MSDKVTFPYYKVQKIPFELLTKLIPRKKLSVNSLSSKKGNGYCELCGDKINVGVICELCKIENS